ncbi:MAG: EF-P 5-aminopentanol modification-associated protein YfmH [Faecalibacillus sp.]
MEKIYYQTLKETLYHEKMNNGLEVYLLPKYGFEKTYGLFSTNFGSIDTTFVPLNQDQMIKVEDGIAHFLEHKMFDMKDGDASDKFASLGASSNAFTSSSRTAYLFSTISHEEECVELLLDFVQSLDITEKSVEKEKGIICQEIKMYEDDPDWRVYFGSIQNLYQKHPIKIDIAGSCETVNRTYKEMLELCYQTFYHPSNMMLFVVGNIDPENLMNVIRNNQSHKSFKKANQIQRLIINEPQEIAVKEKIDTMQVEMNKIIVSIKINDILTNPKDKIKRELSLNILFDMLFSKSSSLYNEWLSKEIINDSFSANFTQERDYAFIQMGGDQDNYQILYDTLIDFIRNIDTLNINKSDFERIKRKNIGNFINMFNSPESIANLFSRYYFEGIDAIKIVDYISEITLDDMKSVLKYFREDMTSVFIVKKDK